MKTIKTFNRTLATVTIVAATSSVAFTSCQQDQLSDSIESDTALNDSALTETNDSIFTNEFKFDYSNAGARTASQYVDDIDFGPSSTGVVSRGAALTPTGIALNVMKFVGMNFINNVTSKGNNKIINAILGDGAAQMEKLDELSTQIKNVSGMIENLSKQAEDESVAQLYNTRMQNYSGLDLNNCSYFDAYRKAVLKKDYNEAKEIANRWAQEWINGTSAPTATYNYINMIYKTANGSQKSMTDIYDYWVYQTTPWEHMGYQKREQLRASDICVATTGYLMSYAYYEQDTTAVGETKIKKLNEAFNDFMTYYTNHISVEHHDDKLVCQIKGAHIVMNKSIVTRDMQSHPWVSNGTRWSNSVLKELMYAEPNHNADYTLAHSLTASEAQAIYNYYNDGKKDKKSMYQIMNEEVGFDMTGLTEGKTHIMTLNSGANTENEHWYNNNYFLKFNQAVDASNASNPMLNDFSIGLIWLEGKGSRQHGRYKVVRQWDRYDSSNRDFFRVDIDHRYNDMKAF